MARPLALNLSRPFAKSEVRTPVGQWCGNDATFVVVQCMNDRSRRNQARATMAPRKKLFAGSPPSSGAAVGNPALSTRTGLALALMD